MGEGEAAGCTRGNEKDLSSCDTALSSSGETNFAHSPSGAAGSASCERMPALRAGPSPRWSRSSSDDDDENALVLIIARIGEPLQVNGVRRGKTKKLLLQIQRLHQGWRSLASRRSGRPTSSSCTGARGLPVCPGRAVCRRSARSGRSAKVACRLLSMQIGCEPCRLPADMISRPSVRWPTGVDHGAQCGCTPGACLAIWREERSGSLKRVRPAVVALVVQPLVALGLRIPHES